MLIDTCKYYIICVVVCYHKMPYKCHASYETDSAEVTIKINVVN